MSREEIEKLVTQLEAIGRMNEILDSKDSVRPSQTALDWMRTNYPDCQADRERARAWRQAQARTILELAEKYQAELNQTQSAVRGSVATGRSTD
jgi:hypothetical protein